MNTTFFRKHVYVTIVTALLLLCGSLTVAYAHDGEDHGDEAEHGLEVAVSHASDVATMKVLIQLLEQLLEALNKKAAMNMGSTMSDMHKDDHAEDAHDHAEHDHKTSSPDEGLYIKVERHGTQTHVHVFQDGVETDKFFVESALDDQAGVIADIVTQTGIAQADVEVAVAFMTGSEMDSEMHDDHDHDEEDDLDGIHIMADGTVMLGNGTVLEDATVNADGMIVLANGTEVEPEMDLR